MSPADTVKDVVRIATTAGLSKAVIDLLQAKATLLAEQLAAAKEENVTLLRENRNLASENQQLKTQVQNARPKGDELDQKTQEILKYVFDKAEEFFDREIAQRFQMQYNVASYHTDILIKKGFVHVIGLGGSMAITEKGRKYIVENGLAG